MFVVLSCSLNPESRSRNLAERAFGFLVDAGVEAELIDLREYPLPLCDGTAAYEAPEVVRLESLLVSAEGILVTAPVYNYDLNAAVKNVVELTGDAWKNKVVGFACSAGGRSSYMSVMGLAASLMLDFHSFIIPRFVYADGKAFTGRELHDPAIEQRLKDLAIELVRVARALAR